MKFGERPPSTPSPGHGSADPAKPGPGPHILLVEDHLDTATVLTRMLRRSGYEVSHAPDVATGLELAADLMKGSGIDLVVSDLSLPDGTGLELMRSLSQRYGLRGIALSGFGMDSDLEQSAAAGFSRHLIKPINIAVVRSTIAELIKVRP